MFAMIFVLQAAAGANPVVEMRELYQARLARLAGQALAVRTNTYTVPLNASPLDRAEWTNRPGRPDAIHRVIRAAGVVSCETYVEDPSAPNGIGVIRSSFDGKWTVTGPFAPDASGKCGYRVEDTATRHGFGESGLCQALEVQLWDSRLPAGYNIASLLGEADCRLVRSVGDVRTFSSSRKGRDVNYRFDVDLCADATPLRLKITFEFATETVTSEQFVLATAPLGGVRVPSETIIVNYGYSRPTRHWTVYHTLVESLERATATREELLNPVPGRNVTVHRYEFTSETPGKQTEVYDAEGRLVPSTERL